MRYSVIDISSSGVSLVVANVTSDTAPAAEIIFKDRIYLSFSYYLEGNNITDRGIEKLIDALNTAKKICAGMGVEKCYVISTASLRMAVNSDHCEAEVVKNTGLFINYIDGETEAYCDYVANSGFSILENPVLVDIGGKSIEICDLSKSEKEDMICLDFGLFDLRNRFIEQENPTLAESEEIKRYIKSKFNDFGVPKKDTYKSVVLAGSTARAVYDVYSEFAKKSSSIGPMTMDRKSFKKMVKYLLSDDSRARLLLTAAPEKVTMIIPACIAIRHIFKRFDVETVIVSDRGVKEGYLNLILQGKEEGICCGLEDLEQELQNKKSKTKKAKKHAPSEAAPKDDNADERHEMAEVLDEINEPVVIPPDEEGDKGDEAEPENMSENKDE